MDNAPDAVFLLVPRDGVAPENYHTLSIFPEYFKINGHWELAKESRMDCVAVLENEFTVNKLSDRGSLSARSIVTNAQDFIVNLSWGLGLV